MKTLFKTLVLGLLLTTAVHAQHEHANHGMLLLGTKEVFASHIVNKVPHNWQVELQIKFPSDIKNTYLQEKNSHPEEKFILVLKDLDLSTIQTAESLAGFVIRVDAQGNKITVIPDVQLARADFQVLHLNELPLSLRADAPVRVLQNPDGPHCVFYPEICL